MLHFDASDGRGVSIVMSRFQFQIRLVGHDTESATARAARHFTFGARAMRARAVCSSSQAAISLNYQVSMHRLKYLLPIVLAAAQTACTGYPAALSTAGIEAPTGAPVPNATPETPDSGSFEPEMLGGSSALRRLSRVEYDNTIEDLLGDFSHSGMSRLPPEVITPDIAFDTHIGSKKVTAQLISSAELLAQDAAARAFANPAIRQRLVPCKPLQPGDLVCLKSFIASFGRLAFRRALSAEEIERYAALRSFSVEENDFYAAPELIVRVMLQDPEFLNRLEQGEVVVGQPTVYKLKGTEIATRLSYFLLGTTPDDALLTLAESGRLSTPEQIRVAAQIMLRAPRAQERVQLFHAQWLGYSQLQVDAPVAAAMQTETRALINRVVFERSSNYLDVFTSPETFVDRNLAQNYGLADPGDKPAWVKYGDAPRIGILGHGTILAATSKAGDTSPTLRGRYISTRLMCRPIPPPDPSVKTDTPPTGGPTTCKADRLAAHTSSGACASCHRLMDPIGWGLENFDREGKFRTVEEGRAQCKISGEGILPGFGSFAGVRGLAANLVSSGTIENCVVRQVHRFAYGRTESDDESRELQSIINDVKSSRKNFQDVLLGIAVAKDFGFRRNEVEGSK
jgi:Protein of unknown function (DUF1592)/Protein of unknown function (DUF1588)/Protein of unknown function (DUF1595)/Protein of unknown function (DUF1585)/Protein of unknown function (DUF1587)